MPNFSKDERLLRSEDFALVYEKGARSFSKNFFISFTGGPKKRIGLTVSSKVGPANVRNRIKRVIREFFRLNKDVFPVGDVVITAKSGAAKLSNSELKDEISKLISKQSR